MKHQRGDAGVGMLAIMVVMVLGYWLFSSHDGGRGGGGHHMMGGHGGAHAKQSTEKRHVEADGPEKDGSGHDQADTGTHPQDER